jgi:colanic acid biosynthesis protein WcaH
MLPQSTFETLVAHAPLFAIDLVVTNPAQEVLLGLRNNPPAQDYWFVPGGRVYKNEPLAQAFARISQAELGQAFAYNPEHQLGLFDHLYADSMFDQNLSTHYINAPFWIQLTDETPLPLPKQQHQAYRWLSLPTLIQDASVHQNSKVFISNLQIKLHPLNLNE